MFVRSALYFQSSISLLYSRENYLSASSELSPEDTDFLFGGGGGTTAPSGPGPPQNRKTGKHIMIYF